MATLNLTDQDFARTIKGNDIVLVDFWATWCGPCRRFTPTYEAASDQHPDVVFAKVDTEAEQALAGTAGIRSIPTLMAFREGVLVFSQPGALPATALEQAITAVKDLDMAQVHAQAAERPDRRRPDHHRPREGREGCVRTPGPTGRRPAPGPVLGLRQNLAQFTFAGGRQCPGRRDARTGADGVAAAGHRRVRAGPLHQFADLHPGLRGGQGRHQLHRRHPQ